MSGILMMVIAIVVLGGAYLLYGRYLQNKRGIDPKAKTPAYELEDGVDYVPADTNVVFGPGFFIKQPENFHDFPYLNREIPDRGATGYFKGSINN